MLKKIALGVLAVVVVLVIVIALQPASFHYERSATFGAPPAVVYRIVNDYHHWNEWSPWAKLDTNLKSTVSGAPAGVGAKYAWEGETAGSGTMEIIDSTPGMVKMDLHFTKPFEAKNAVAFAVAAEGAGTKITWTMDGANSFGAKAAGLFMDMKGMIETDFDKGLAALKGVAETEAARVAAEEKKAAEAAAAAAAAAAAPVDAAAEAVAPK